MDGTISFVEVLLRLSTALACGAVLGWERETHGKPAGFRTNMLVALGAAAFTLVSLNLYLGTVADVAAARPDPLRVVQGVIGGMVDASRLWAPRWSRFRRLGSRPSSIHGSIKSNVAPSSPKMSTEC